MRRIPLALAGEIDSVNENGSISGPGGCGCRQLPNIMSKIDFGWRLRRC